MSTPQEGDFFLAKITGWTGFWVRVMQWFNGDGAKWTHAGIYLGNGRLYEAQPGGAVVTPIERYAGRPMRWSTDVVLLTEQERKDIVDNATALVGVGYGWLTYLYLGLYRLRVRPQWLKREVMRTSDMICSQSVDEAYNRSGVHLFDDGRMPQDVTPGDLARLLDHWVEQ